MDKEKKKKSVVERAKSKIKDMYEKSTKPMKPSNSPGYGKKSYEKMKKKGLDK